MDRKEFVKHFGISCLACLGVSFLLDSCVATHYVEGLEGEDGLMIGKKEFVTENEKQRFRKYLIVKNQKLNYPIVVYRFSDNEYSALLLRCTHQGYELNVNGDLISCTAHGSEFTNKGVVTSGPAERNLKSFPVIIEQDFINIIIS